jgi:hypothetical protein
MTDQAEALLLADRLEGRYALHPEVQQAAAELRRLHEVEQQRDELLAALKLVRDRFFPEDQPVRDRDSMWGPVNAAMMAARKK